MEATTNQRGRELAYRSSGGIDVTLLWNDETGDAGRRWRPKRSRNRQQPGSLSSRSTQRRTQMLQLILDFLPWTGRSRDRGDAVVSRLLGGAITTRPRFAS
jgi:hypothetical protein